MKILSDSTRGGVSRLFTQEEHYILSPAALRVRKFMSQDIEKVIHSAPVGQHFSREEATEYVSPNIRKDVCACCRDDKIDCGTWWFGFCCSCILIGSSYEMKKNNFTKKTDFCSGCGNKVCCGMCLGHLFGDWLFGAGAFFSAGIASCENDLHEREGCDWFLDYCEYLFCMPCRSCADYSSALAQVDANNEKNL